MEAGPDREEGVRQFPVFQKSRDKLCVQLTVKSVRSVRSAYTIAGFI